MSSDVRDGGRRQLQIVAAALAAIPFLTGLAAMIAGPSTLPGDNSRLEPSADSEYRFASAFWFAVAPVIWSTVPRIERQGPRLRAVCSVVFLGGLARLASWRRTGRPHPLFVGAIALELIGMPLLVAWQAKVDRRSADAISSLAPAPRERWLAAGQDAAHRAELILSIVDVECLCRAT